MILSVVMIKWPFQMAFTQETAVSEFKMDCVSWSILSTDAGKTTYIKLALARGNIQWLILQSECQILERETSVTGCLEEVGSCVQYFSAPLQSKKLPFFSPRILPQV